jgi:hypothetical protein
MRSRSSSVALIALIAGCLVAVGCSNPKPWPQSPLYETPANDPNWEAPASREEAIEAAASGMREAFGRQEERND